ncbi:MAG: 50S ribosomal protein L9 [Chloroflexi bacterium RBG_16_68_14]|nr:MAG: 50S ribosomal protein L9 [Chloroflexi bacterium RBG_16_68_14]
MKVVFLEDVEGTAQVGEVKEVKNGFARNYLLPHGLAAPAVEPYLSRAQARAVRVTKQQEELDHDAAAVAERLEGARITISARVGEQGKLYGSVTAVHIAAEVAKLIGQEEFDHRKVLLPEAIREVGVQPVRLRLTRNVEPAIEVEVLAEGEEAVAEQPQVASAEEAEAEAGEAEEQAEEVAEEPQEGEGA